MSAASDGIYTSSDLLPLRAIADDQQARLRSPQVRAPDAGVLQKLTLQLRQWVPEGTMLAKVEQPGQLKAVLRIPESQANHVQLGQRATVDTRNGIVSGKVTRKHLSAQSAGSGTTSVFRLKADARTAVRIPPPHARYPQGSSHR